MILTRFPAVLMSIDALHSGMPKEHACGSPRTSGTPVAIIIGGEDGVPDFKDPLQKPRPKYDLAAASGRPDEVVWGAVAPNSKNLIEWASHLRENGIKRLLSLLTDEEASVRVSGGASEYAAALVAAGFEADKVANVDLSSADSLAEVSRIMQEAKAAREKVCIHCDDGEKLTAVVMAYWLLFDYIGGDNHLEACDALESRKRLSGVGRRAKAEDVEELMESGCLAPRRSDPGASGLIF